MPRDISIRVPDIGDFDDVEVIEILVSEGETISLDQSLVTLESEKATMEIPATSAGVVRKIHVHLGERVIEGSALVTVHSDLKEEEVAVLPEHSSAEKEDRKSDTSLIVEPKDAEGEKKVVKRYGREEAPESDFEPSTPLRIGGAHASPSIRRMAAELGVDLSLVSGSGRKGRVRKEDVRTFVKSAVITGGPSLKSAKGTERRPQVDFSRFGEIENVPENKIRRVSARNLQRSWSDIPHVTHFDEVDITELEIYRGRKKHEAEARGLRLTLLAFLMQASAKVLAEFPRLNSSLDLTGDSLIFKKFFHIGVAVDTENGLVVPVIRDVEQKGLWQLASEISEVSERARARKLTPVDLSGGCFSISSLGGIGGVGFTPIVNSPEVAILGVSRAEMKPVYREDQFEPRLMLPLSLSYDHRVIDGAYAARVTRCFADLLGDLRNLLL